MFFFVFHQTLEKNLRFLKYLNQFYHQSPFRPSAPDSFCLPVSGLAMCAGFIHGFWDMYRIHHFIIYYSINSISLSLSPIPLGSTYLATIPRHTGLCDPTSLTHILQRATLLKTFWPRATDTLLHPEQSRPLLPPTFSVNPFSTAPFSVTVEYVQEDDWFALRQCVARGNPIVSSWVPSAYEDGKWNGYKHSQLSRIEEKVMASIKICFITKNISS